jgi:hypothetical protein
VEAVFVDDLPAISISRLRAMDIITAETTSFSVKLGHVEREVRIHLWKFRRGGSFSYFGCPTCGKWARTLRLHGDDIVCLSCCRRRRIRHRCEPMGLKQRAELRIPKLRAMLERTESARLKPVLWGKMERRSRYEATLKRAEFIVGRYDFTDPIEKDKSGE